MTRYQFAICIDDSGYAVSLERRKIYETLPDPDAARQGFIRVIDESGEDYLYQRERFAAIELPKPIEEAVVKLA
jgi:hypothetical protein